MRAIGVLTAGGDCPGLNAVIRGVVARAAAQGVETVGVLDGWRGLMEGRVRPLDVAGQPSYVASMRRRVRPLWFPAPAPEHMPAAESALLDSAQKGALDFPAIVHGPIENAVVARLCRTAVTPNQLTVAAAAVAWTGQWSLRQ